LTVGGLLDTAAEHHGDIEAVVVRAYPGTEFNVRWTYRELHRRAEELAATLIRYGCRHGDRAAIWAPNVPEWLVVEFALAKIGMVAVTINPTYQSDELAYVLQLSGARLLFYLPEWERFDLENRLSRIRDRAELDLEVALGSRRSSAGFTLGEFCAKYYNPAVSVRERETLVGPDDVVQIQFTSGTSGRPKGVQLTHRGIVNSSRELMLRWQVQRGEKWCSAAPLFHIVGNAMMALGCPAVGATYLPLIWFDADRILETIERERVGYLQTVPTTLLALLERQKQKRHDLSALRIVEIGGAPVAEILGHRTRAELGVELRNCYGLTETSGCLTQTDVDELGDLGFRTVGRPVPGIDLRIVDRTTTDVVAPGDVGELHARGYLITPGYLGDDKKTAETIIDGWFHTGDLARLLPTGHVEIVGRLTGVIRRGAEAIDPLEVENVLRNHADVREVVVLGVPDEFFGEAVCAVIESAVPLSRTDLRAWMKGKLSHQKIPAHFLVEPDLPKTPSGKVRRPDVRAIALARLGLDNAGTSST
jgi:acyl-CoA synthetase (AMP-forming)/AMP-acid ligase II